MRGVVVSVAAAVAALVLVPAAMAATAVTVTPTSGPPGTSVTLAGTGFDPSTRVDVYLDTTQVALTTSNASGAVSLALTIPDATQPGTHWVTLDEASTHRAAQASFTVSTDWPQTGYGPSKRSFNPRENTINTGNVSQLTRVWSQPLDGFANSKPMIVYKGDIFVRDANQVVRAFSPAGKLLWTATTPFSTFPDSLTPAAAANKVFFTDLNGNVIAYNYNCRSDGGTCVPAWTKNMGAAAAGGITFRLGKLYVPAADGVVHVFTPGNGAAGPNITVTSAALTSWIAFGADGGGFVAHGSSMAETRTNTGSSSDVTYSGTLSSPAVGADTAYSTESDSLLREMQFSWTTPLSGSCSTETPPALANGLVYAAGCSSLGAYDPGTGAADWTISTPGPSAGLAVANGVLYACVNNRLIAYAASYGGRLWTGGYCSAAPTVVNGVLYNTWSNVSAYTLSGAQATVRFKRPDPATLVPTISPRRGSAAAGD